MVKVGYFDPNERALEKQRSRDQDQADLESGKVSKEELSKRNGFFSSLDIKNGTIVRRSSKFR